MYLSLSYLVNYHGTVSFCVQFDEALCSHVTDTFNILANRASGLPSQVKQKKSTCDTAE